MEKHSWIFIFIFFGLKIKCAICNPKNETYYNLCPKTTFKNARPDSWLVFCCCDSFTLDLKLLEFNLGFSQCRCGSARDPVSVLPPAVLSFIRCSLPLMKSDGFFADWGEKTHLCYWPEAF